MTQISTVRERFKTFYDLMELRMKFNQKKKDWRDSDYTSLLRKLNRNFELAQFQITKKAPISTMESLADVANYCAMMCDWLQVHQL